MDVPRLRISKTTYPRSDEVPIPAFHHIPELTESSNEISSYVDAAITGSSESELEGAATTSLRSSQAKLYDLIRDLSLLKETSEVIAFLLNEKNLQPRTRITFYRTREKVLLPDFSIQIGFLK